MTIAAVTNQPSSLSLASTQHLDPKLRRNRNASSGVGSLLKNNLSQVNILKQPSLITPIGGASWDDSQLHEQAMSEMTQPLIIQGYGQVYEDLPMDHSAYNDDAMASLPIS